MASAKTAAALQRMRLDPDIVAERRVAAPPVEVAVENKDAAGATRCAYLDTLADDPAALAALAALAAYAL